MELWRNHASNFHSPLSIWCYTAALHFAAGVSKLEQSKIHCDRAWEYYENRQLSEWEKDIEVSKTLDYRPAIVSTVMLQLFLVFSKIEMSLKNNFNH